MDTIYENKKNTMVKQGLQAVPAGKRRTGIHRGSHCKGHLVSHLVGVSSMRVISPISDPSRDASETSSFCLKKKATTTPRHS